MGFREAWCNEIKNITLGTLFYIVLICVQGYIFVSIGKDVEVQSRQLVKELEADGWVLDRVTGSHHMFKHPEKSQTVPVPHPKKDLPLGTVKAIRKLAGLA